MNGKWRVIPKINWKQTIGFWVGQKAYKASKYMRGVIECFPNIENVLFSVGIKSLEVSSLDLKKAWRSGRADFE